MRTVAKETALGRAWTQNYPDGIDYFAELDFTPLYQQVLANCKAMPDADALDFFGTKTTYGELGRDIERVAGALQKNLGLKKGDRLALMLPNVPYFPVLYYAAHMIGVTVVNCNPLYTLSELTHIIGNAEIDYLVTLDLAELFEKAEKLMDAGIIENAIICEFSAVLPTLKRTLFKLVKRDEFADPSRSPHAANFVYWRDLLAADLQPEPVEIDPETDIAVIQYTGGTTGLPKGAMLSHKNISANVAQLDLWALDLFTPPSKVIAVIPFFHVFAMTVCMNIPLSRGLEVLMLPRFDLMAMMAMIKREKPNILVAVPTLTHTIVSHRMARRVDLTCLDVCISGGAPIDVATRHLFGEVTSGIVGEGYGLSECAPVLSCSPIYEVMKDNSIGQPIPGTDISFRDLEDPAKEVPNGTRGEIFAKGPQVMLGYLDNEEANAESFMDGYFRTGDVGYVDDDGHIFLVDRIKDLILCSGFNVYPRVIEDALYGHDAVIECIVFGTHDGYRGEAPIAFVVLDKGAKLSEKEMRDYLSGIISKIEMPREIHFRDELPKTLIGKLSKKDLKAEYEAERKS